MDQKKNRLNDEVNDQYLKDLFHDFEPEMAPESLKQDTMNRVFKDWTENAVAYKPLINKQNRWWIIIGCAALVAISFLIDGTLIQGYINQVEVDQSIIDLSGVKSGLNSVGTTIKELPSILYLTVIGGSALLVLDRFFNRLANI